MKALLAQVTNSSILASISSTPTTLQHGKHSHNRTSASAQERDSSRNSETFRRRRSCSTPCIARGGRRTGVGSGKKLRRSVGVRGRHNSGLRARAAADSRGDFVDIGLGVTIIVSASAGGGIDGGHWGSSAEGGGDEIGLRFEVVAVVV